MKKKALIAELRDLLDGWEMNFSECDEESAVDAWARAAEELRWCLQRAGVADIWTRGKLA